MLLGCWLTCALAASMQPKKERDEAKLEKLAKLLRPFAIELPQDETCLDKLLTDDHLCLLLQNTTFEEARALGALLSDLSVDRFDSFCTQADFYLGGDLRRALAIGYSQTGSRWHQAHKQSISVPISEENARHHLLCHRHDDFMIDRPADILSQNDLEGCLTIWHAEGKNEQVRQALLKAPHINALSKLYPAVFHNGAEYLAVLKRVLSSPLMFPSQFELPDSLTSEHLEDLRQFLRRFSPYRGLVFLGKGADSLNAMFIDFSLTGFDTAPLEGTIQRELSMEEVQRGEAIFNDGWAVPRQLRKEDHALLYNLRHNLPMKLKDAFDAFYHFGNRQILQATFQSIKVREEVLGGSVKSVIVAAFDSWLWTSRLYTPRVMEIFKLVAPHLRQSLSHYPRWHNCPFYENILANPGEHRAQEVEWANDSLQELQAEEDLYKGGGPASFIFLCLAKGWTGLLQRLALDYWHLLPVRPEVITLLSKDDPIEALLARSINSMAISANISLLDEFLALIDPESILAMAKHSIVRDRITIMLHLSPKVTSYCGSQPVNKNCSAFAAWIETQLRSDDHVIADRKLSKSYQMNLATNLYSSIGVDQVCDNLSFTPA